MLGDLVRRGPTAYVNFLDCLDNSGHEHLAKIIKEKENTIRNGKAHPPTDSSNHGDTHLHLSASAGPLFQHNLSNLSDNSHSFPIMSSFGSMVTSSSDGSASNHGDTSLSEQDNNTTDEDKMVIDTDRSIMSSQGNWICIGTL
jgi:hypothetical protein